MMKRVLLALGAGLIALSVYMACVPSHTQEPLPKGFVYVEELIPSIKLELRYYSNHNFVGARIDGYLAPRCILTKNAAKALANVQKELSPFGLGLKVFDAYRPQQAVNHFMRWAEDLDDKKMKAEFYPALEKKDLFDQGYIAKRSGHTRGSSIDLTLVSLHDGKELDMGGPFDFFGETSWPHFKNLSQEQRANRMLLRAIMTQYGFRPYKMEWWHFRLEKEPFPKTYFDFPVR